MDLWPRLRGTAIFNVHVFCLSRSLSARCLSLSFPLALTFLRLSAKVCHPHPRVEIEWVRILRSLHSFKTLYGPLVSKYLDTKVGPALAAFSLPSTPAISTDTQTAPTSILQSAACPGRLCPLLAFVFDDVRDQRPQVQLLTSFNAFVVLLLQTSILSIKELKMIEGENGELSVYHSSIDSGNHPEAETPTSSSTTGTSGYHTINTHTKLQQALEAQVRALLRKPKMATGTHDPWFVAQNTNWRLAPFLTKLL